MPKPQPKPVDLKDIVNLAKATMEDAKFPMLATVEKDQPRLRPVSPVLTEGFTVYIANLKSYDKTGQISRNPKVELCYLDQNHNQVRITGVAEVVLDPILLQKIWNKNRLLEHYLGSIDNPELIVYKIIPTKVRYMQEWALDYYEVPFN